MQVKKDRFKRRFGAKISTRAHMTLILLMTMASGVVASKLLLFMGLGIPMIRYGLAVLISYGAFFFFVYCWLIQMFGNRKSNLGVEDAVDFIPDTNFQINSSPSQWSGSGGNFSGGGASASYAEVGQVAETSTEVLDKATDGWDFDEAVVIVVIIAFIAAILGSATYIIYQAPEILLEAAFEVFLAAGLIRKTRDLPVEGWAVPILKGTWVAFAIVLVAAIGFGFFVHLSCPEARSFGESRVLCTDS